MVQRRIFEECKRRQELDKLYEETAKKNAEEQRRILEEIAEKEKEREEREAREAAENEIRFKKEQPKLYATQLFPTQQAFPVYYMDTEYNMCTLWGQDSRQVENAKPVTKANPVVYDELRDNIWPTLRKLSALQKELRAKLFNLNQKVNTVRPFAEAAYRRSILQAFANLHLTNQSIRLLSFRQNELMVASWKERMFQRQ